MSARLDRIVEKLAALEVASGINPACEIITQRDDGTWPEPQTNAPLIVERVNFRANPTRALEARNRELAADVAVERAALERVNAAPAARRAK